MSARGRTRPQRSTTSSPGSCRHFTRAFVLALQSVPSIAIARPQCLVTLPLRIADAIGSLDTNPGIRPIIRCGREAAAFLALTSLHSYMYTGYVEEDHILAPSASYSHTLSKNVSTGDMSYSVCNQYALNKWTRKHNLKPG